MMAMVSLPPEIINKLAAASTPEEIQAVLAFMNTTDTNSTNNTDIGIEKETPAQTYERLEK